MVMGYATRQQVEMARSAEIDGLRGILALTVLVFHAVVFATPANEVMALTIANIPAQAAVIAFFVISGYVLIATPTSSKPLAFLWRRTRRLVPMHIGCMVVGAFLLSATAQFWRDVLFIYPDRSAIDGPDWSLRVEMVATVFWPLIVLCARRLSTTVVSSGCFVFLSWATWYDLFWVPLFILGARLQLIGARLPRIAWLRSDMVQFLGRISFSLYMTHWIAIKAAGPAIGGLIAIPVATLAYVLVEKPSLDWSRGRSIRSQIGQTRPRSTPRGRDSTEAV